MTMHMRTIVFDMGAVSCLQLIIGWLIMSVMVGCATSGTGPGNPRVPKGAKSSSGKHARIETDKGNIKIEFFESDSPQGGGEFSPLGRARLLRRSDLSPRCQRIHDPRGEILGGDGTGGESAWGGSFDDDIDRESALYQRGYRRGIVAMANSGPDTNGSQFFIMHGNSRLPPNYVIFGNVVEGQEVVDALASVPTARSSNGEMSRPIQPLVIRKVVITP